MNYQELIDQEIKFLKRIPTDSIERIVEIISSLSTSTRICTTGMGKAGQIAHTLSTTLSSTGSPSYFIHPAEAQHGDLGMICKGDCVIAISNSGKTREVLEFIHLCKKLHNGIQVYGIIGDQDSDMSLLCDDSIVYGPVEEICPLRLTPTTSTTAAGVVCDLIVVGLMTKKKFSKSDYSLTHHGGYLHKKASEV